MSRILLEAHAHTSEVSRCSKLPAARLVERMHAAGYGALIVTDRRARIFSRASAQRAKPPASTAI